MADDQTPPPGRWTRRSPVKVLRFADGDLEGLVIRVRVMSVGALKDLLTKLDELSERPLEGMPHVAQSLADHLIGWNIDDENGNPVPATYEGVLSLDPAELGKIGHAWMKSLSGAVPVDSPLGESSPSGVPSAGEEPELPMESL
jgi:hypothetical protein